MKVVLAHGVFDLLHSGHVEHLLLAKAAGDKLLVSVVADKFVRKPYLINNQATRMFMLAALKVVDEVYLCDALGPEKLLETLRPDIYARSSEYIDKSKPEYAVCERLGIQTCFTTPIPLHTSDLIERIRKHEPRT